MIDPDEDLAFGALRDLLAAGYFGKYLGVGKDEIPRLNGTKKP